MKFKLNKLILGLILISIIGTAIIYPELPQRIPIHWNAAGKINNYGNKPFAFLTAIIPAILYLFFIFIPRIDPKKESYKLHGKAYEVFISVIMIFLIMIHWVSMAVALGYNVNMSLFISLSIGILFIVMGNYMGQIRHNYFFGIRTPWTLASEKVWTKTHRIGGYGFIIGGLIFIAAGLINNAYGIRVSLIYILLLTVYLFIYSYMLFKKQNNKN